MALILHLETATNSCSVALSKNGVILSLNEEKEGRSHASLLTILIEQCFRETNLKLADIDAVAVSKGPGSFTGLRIGVATAKGICFSLDKPLIGLNTLQSMASVFQMKFNGFSEALLCPMIDARRMEVYTAVFNPDLSIARETSATILTEDFCFEMINRQKIAFFGDGMSKFESIFGMHENAQFVPDFTTSASGMVKLAENSYKEGKFESVAYFEPFYLKDFFNPTQPHKVTTRQ